MKCIEFIALRNTTVIRGCPIFLHIASKRKVLPKDCIVVAQQLPRMSQRVLNHAFETSRVLFQYAWGFHAVPSSPRRQSKSDAHHSASKDP